MTLPELISKKEIAERLEVIFPKGTSHRGYIIRELSVSTIFVMIYIGAIEGSGIYLGPKHVYKMTNVQAELVDEESRLNYSKDVLTPGKVISGEKWYADNTRESIRDETLRAGLIALGAATTKPGIPPTSSKPRYSLKRDFAELFNPLLKNEELLIAIENWQKQNLTTSALARVKLVKDLNLDLQNDVLVTFPNKETRRLSAGLSSNISKQVIESFATKYLKAPAVLWLSESGNKEPIRDVDLARKIGLQINAAEELPDIILVDLDDEGISLVFVEVVATDGAITKRRMEAIYGLTDAAGFERSDIIFVTAYEDRNSTAFKKTVPELAGAL